MPRDCAAGTTNNYCAKDPYNRLASDAEYALVAVSIAATRWLSTRDSARAITSNEQRGSRSARSDPSMAGRVPAASTAALNLAQQAATAPDTPLNTTAVGLWLHFSGRRMDATFPAARSATMHSATVRAIGVNFDWAVRYQGETWMLDSPVGVCAGQARSEYPATSVPFSNSTSRDARSDYQLSGLCLHS
jgi:hypothetical protein